MQGAIFSEILINKVNEGILLALLHLRDDRDFTQILESSSSPHIVNQGMILKQIMGKVNMVSGHVVNMTDLLLEVF